MRFGLMPVVATAGMIMPVEATIAQGRPAVAPAANRDGAATVANGKIRCRVIGDLAGGKPTVPAGFFRVLDRRTER